MRTLRLLLAVTVAGLLGLVTAGVAHAQTTTTVPAQEHETTGGEQLGADEQKCVDKLLAGGTVEDCPKKPNAIVPKLNEVIWGAGFFAVVTVFMLTYGAPRMRKGLSSREAKIRDDLQSAERDRAEAEQVRVVHRNQLAEARAEANEVIDEARRAADAVRQDLMARAEADAAALRAQTAEEIRQATERALTGLQAQVATLSIELAERVVERPLDRSSQLTEVEALIRQAGDGSN